VGDLASLDEVLSDVSTGCVQRGDFDSARRYAARALEVAERLDDPTLIAEIECSCFYVDAYTGNWEQARAHVERGVAMSRRIGVFWRSAYPLIERGRLCLCEGAWEEASGYLAEGVALAEPSGNLEALREAQYLLAERDLREGRPEAARARLVPLLDR